MLSPLEKEKWKPALYYSQSGKIVLDDTLIKNANGFSYKIKSRKKISPDYVARIICDILNFDQSELYGFSRTHHSAKMRALIARYWLKYSGLTLTEIAALFERTASTLHNQISQLENADNKYLNNDALQKIDEEIKNYQSE